MQGQPWDEVQPYFRLITPKRIILAIVILLLIAVSLTSMYTVEADEVAVVLRFGKYIDTTQPGLRFKLPFGIDQVIGVPVERVFKEEFGFRTLRAGVRTQYDPRDYSDESLLLTGDLNIADVEWVVQYQISEPQKFLFAIRDATRSLRDLSEAVMRTVVGDRTVTEVLTVGRIEIAAEVKQRLQELLDRYNTGLILVNVTLQDVNPPETVKPSFNAVNEAKQEKEKLINEARKDYNESVPKAKGVARQQILEAEGYALKRVNEARGDADRFNAIRREYQNAKAVTRRRLYLEAMSTVLPKVKEIYVIDGKSNAPLPILQLDK
ncbi:FtsH protease activity modulator HflK [Candidatus Poribacteria bacterium]|nr:FtsH protease activity modulator HflK [Candidatus Poribacteria bacterium]